MRKFILLSAIIFAINFSYAKEFKNSFQEIFPGADVIEKVPYSKVIKELYLAKGANNQIIGGAAVRVFKSYKKVTAFLVIKKEDNKFKVVKAAVPDAKKIGKDEYINKVNSVAKDFENKVIKENSSVLVKVDATAEATKYHKKAYLTFNLLAENIINEIENN